MKKIRYLCLAIFIVFLIISYQPTLIGNENSEEKIIYRSSEDLLIAMEKVYGKIETLRARLNMIDTDPKSSPLLLNLSALSGEQYILRVEFIAPSTMKGQFFLVEGENLYQYMPADKTLIVNDLSRVQQSKVPSSLRSLNIAPNRLTGILNSEDIKLELKGTPDSPYTSDLKELDILSENNNTDSSDKKDVKITPEKYPQLKKLTEGGVYVLEVTPKKEEADFERQILSLDGETLLPQILITYPAGEEGNRYLTFVEEIEKNIDLDIKKVTKLPPESEATYIRP